MLMMTMTMVANTGKKNIYILSPHDLVLTNMFYIFLSPFKVKELPVWEVRA